MQGRGGDIGIHVNVKTGFVIGTFKNGWEMSYRQTNVNVAFVKRAKELLAADSVQLSVLLTPQKARVEHENKDANSGVDL